MEGERFALSLSLSLSVCLPLGVHVHSVHSVISMFFFFFFFILSPCFFFLSVLWWASASHMCRNVLMNPTLWSRGSVLGSWGHLSLSLSLSLSVSLAPFLVKHTLKFECFCLWVLWQMSDSLLLCLLYYSTNIRRGKDQTDSRHGSRWSRIRRSRLLTLVRSRARRRTI